MNKSILKTSDEYYTPDEAWDNISQYLSKDKWIFEAFFGEGHTYKYFEKNGYNVVGEKGLDFFSDDADFFMEVADCVVSNPPFSIKYKVMDTLVRENMPFILILPLACINTKSFRKCFNNCMNDVSIMIPKGRMRFIQSSKLLKPASFENCYVCYKMVHEKLVFLSK